VLRERPVEKVDGGSLRVPLLARKQCSVGPRDALLLKKQWHTGSKKQWHTGSKKQWHTGSKKQWHTGSKKQWHTGSSTGW